MADSKKKLPDTVFLAVSAVAVLLSQLIAKCASGLSTIAWISFAVQWIVFIHAGWNRTEMFFDLTGSITYFSLSVYSFLNARNDFRQMILSIMVVIWATRLGTFLFGRIHKAGKDSRFDKVKHRLPRFFNFWTIQGLWVFLTALPVWIVNSDTRPFVPITTTDHLGWAMWAAGFVIEVVADWQKSVFRGDDANKTKFIRSGLWAYSRHPNYFGEIVLWVGVYISSTNVLVGAEHVAILSPLFVIFLLTRVSGIPLLEKSADEKWGKEPAYQKYKASTGVLVPGIMKG